MVIKYCHLKPGSQLPDISILNPFQSVVVIEESTSRKWQALVSDWLVKSGCFFMMAWGNDCSTWDDSVDLANLKEFDFEYIPEDKFVMTTWHANEPLKEVFWFSKYAAFNPTAKLSNTVILHITSISREQELLSEYADA